jgi:hypothetical protein
MTFLAGAGLVMILSGLGAYYATDALSWFSVTNLLTGPLLLAAAALLASRRVRGFSGALSRRVVLRWSALVLLVLGAVLLANAAVKRSGAMLDLTFDRLYTLAPQTLALCRELEVREEGVPELLLFEDAKLADDVRMLTQAYQSACPIDVRALERNEAPEAAADTLREFETTLVVCLTGRCEPVGFPSERNITNALLRLVRLDAPIAYFLVGHGELDMASEGAFGGSALVGAMRDEGILVRAWVGPAQSEPPPDAQVVIAAAPERNLLDGELRALRHYLERGGRLLVLLDPSRSSNLERLLEDYGFALPPGIVADPAASPLLPDPQPLNLLVGEFDRFHRVTRPLDARTLLILSGVRPVITLAKPAPDDRLVPLIYSGDRAWVERDAKEALAGRPITRDEADEPAGSVPLAAAGAYPRGGRETRIVVIGDLDFARNRLLDSLYNADLVLNAVEWLLEDEHRIALHALRPKYWRVDDAPLTVQQTLGYFYSLAFALPEALLLLGLHAWWRQRR